MVFTAPAIIGLVVMIIGIILVVVGVILYELNVQNKRKQQWYVWLLIGLGVGLAVIGAIVTLVFMRKVPDITTYDYAPSFASGSSAAVEETETSS